ncbi:MAG: PH domain-containing protein [Micromonosporaceae bacterium]|nr:PH domain-containing protein [Micromonosporaceae bacterium]
MVRPAVARLGRVEHRWRIPRKVPIGKLAVAAIVGVVGGFAGSEAWQFGVVAAVVAGLVAWAARDLVEPVRLRADPAGLTVVTGFARRRRLGWPQVERVRVDVRRRSRLLEVDTGEALYLFSRYDVDADLDQVAGQLELLRAAAAR